MSSAHALPSLDISRTAPTPFWRLVKVELRKSVDTRASFWLVASIAILVALVDVGLLLIVLLNDVSVAYGDFVSGATAVTSLLLPVLGIILVTGEWGQRTAMVTFSLEPRRIQVVLAKLVVGLLLTVIAVVIALIVSLVLTGVCELVQPDRTTWEVQVGDQVGFLATQMLAMAGGFALATLLLNTPAAIVLFVVYLYVVPVILLIISGLWDAFATVSPYVNLVEAQVPLAEFSLGSGEEWAQLLVATMIWVVVPIGLGITRIVRAEVK